MKSLVLLAVALSHPTAFAAPNEIISCNFTEPFFTVSYDDSLGLLMRELADDEIRRDEETGETLVTIRRSYDAQKIKTGKNTYIVKNARGRVVLELTRDFNGSDGMSDVTYAYSAKSDGFVGGCRSNLYKSKEPSYK